MVWPRCGWMSLAACIWASPSFKYHEKAGKALILLLFARSKSKNAIKTLLFLLFLLYFLKNAIKTLLFLLFLLFNHFGGWSGPGHLPKSLKSRKSRKSSVFIAFFEKDSRKNKKSNVFIAFFNLDINKRYTDTAFSVFFCYRY